MLPIIVLLHCGVRSDNATNLELHGFIFISLFPFLYLVRQLCTKRFEEPLETKVVTELVQICITQLSQLSILCVSRWYRHLAVLEAK